MGTAAHRGLADATLLHPWGYTDHRCQEGVTIATRPSDNDSTAQTPGGLQRAGAVTALLSLGLGVLTSLSASTVSPALSTSAGGSEAPKGG